MRRLKGLYHYLLACCAVVWFRFPSRHLTVVGVTGTDGKTTTTTLIYEVLKAAGKNVSMITSVHAVIAGQSYDTGFHVTTPSAWWVQKYLREAVDHGDTHMVLEVTSHALSQSRVFGVRFAAGVITNVTHEHLDWHKTYDDYLQTKLRLVSQSEVSIINHDQADLFSEVTKNFPDKKIVSFGMQHGADLTPKLFPFHTKLPGQYNEYNCLAAIAACQTLGIEPAVIRRTLETFSGISGRMEVVATKPFTVIVDFAHTPNALEQVLKTVRGMTKKKLIHVFGSAGLRDHTKRPLMGAASGRYADAIILTEEDYRTEDVNKIMDEITTGIPKGKNIQRYPRRADAIRVALGMAKPGDLVILTGKGHEKSLCRGTVEYPWSDQQEVRNVLKH